MLHKFGIDAHLVGQVFERFAGHPMIELVGLHVHIMQGLGWLMVLLYMHLYFAPFRRLKEAVITEQWPEAAKQLNQIRTIVGINLSLGLIVIAVAAGGRYMG